MQQTALRDRRAFSAGLIILINACVYMCPAIFTTFFSAFLSRNGLTASQIGILFSLSPLMYIVATPFWARLADRTGKRAGVLIAVCLGTAASLLLFSVSRGFAGYLIAALLLNAFVTSVVPLSDSIVLGEAARLRIPFSVVRMGGTIGFALVVVACGFFFSARPGMMFPVAAASFLAFAALLTLLPRKRANNAGVKTPVVQTASSVRLLSHLTPEFWSVLLFGFLGYIGLMFIAAYLGAYMLSLGYGNVEIGIASTISALSEIPTLLLIRRLMRKVPLVGILFASCMLFALRAFLVSMGTLAFIFGSSLLQSVTYMPLYYCCVTYVCENLPAERQSQGQSLLVLFQAGLGGAIGYLLGGQIIQWIGIRDAYRVFAGLELIGGLALAALYYWFHHRKRGTIHGNI